MAKFSTSFNADYAFLSGEDIGPGALGQDDLLEVLRPAAAALRDRYKTTVREMGLVQTGEFVDSIDFEDDAFGSNRGRKYSSASFVIGPTGSRKKSRYTRRSRAGSSNGKYAKHNRKVSTKNLKNQELGYFLEYGTPRMPATHWMENTNEKSAEEIQQIIDKNFTDLLKQKGLI